MDDDEGGFGWMIPLLLLGIGLLFLFAWLSKSAALPTTLAGATQVVKVCKAGTVPAYLIESKSLEAGKIINDD